jgi:hypothetical protein
LDLAFLIDGEDQGLVRRIEVQADHVVELLDKVLIAADFEGPDEMRLGVVALLDAPDRGLAEPLGLGHGPCAPVGGSRRGRMQSGLDNGSHLAVGDVGETTRTRGVFLQACQAESHKPLPPELHRGPGNGQLPCNVLVDGTRGRHLNDSGPLCQSERDASARSAALAALTSAAVRPGIKNILV